MKRRRLIKQLGITGGAAFLIPSVFTTCASEDYQPSFLTKEQFQLIDAFGEFTLPASEKSPGASQAKVANFIDKYIAVCFNEKQKFAFQKGILAFENQCLELHNKGFVKLTPIEKGEMLNNQENYSTDFLEELNQLVLFGYFTSQEGVTQALRYVTVPGKYEGDIKYKKGDSAWAL